MTGHSPDTELTRLLENVRKSTCAEKQKQRISFAYGNVALSGSRATKADVTKAAAVDCQCCNGTTEGLSADDQELAAAGDCYCPEECQNS